MLGGTGVDVLSEQPEKSNQVGSPEQQVAFIVQATTQWHPLGYLRAFSETSSNTVCWVWRVIPISLLLMQPICESINCISAASISTINPSACLGASFETTDGSDGTLFNHTGLDMPELVIPNRPTVRRPVTVSQFKAVLVQRRPAFCWTVKEQREEGQLSSRDREPETRSPCYSPLWVLFTAPSSWPLPKSSPQAKCHQPQDCPGSPVHTPRSPPGLYPSPISCFRRRGRPCSPQSGPNQALQRAHT